VSLKDDVVDEEVDVDSVSTVAEHDGDSLPGRLRLLILREELSNADK